MGDVAGTEHRLSFGSTIRSLKKKLQAHDNMIPMYTHKHREIHYLKGERDTVLAEVFQRMGIDN